MAEGVVFDIQHYAVHDGPGIRTLVFLKGCPLRCPWCCNPESQSFVPELKHSALRCRACLACVATCSQGEIEVVEDRPHFAREGCGTCDATPCVQACPHGSLAVMGERMTAEQVMARVGADKAFYDNSGGGVTFSGGEPFAQPMFLEEMLRCSKDLGIHTAVETCGYADAQALSRCEPFVDLFLFDLKVMDPARHQELTGASNELILNNCRALAVRDAGKLRVRVPIVPGCTDDSDNVASLAAFARSLDLSAIELLPYHTLGLDKYASLGREYPLRRETNLGAEFLQRVVSGFQRHGLTCEIGGG